MKKLITFLTLTVFIGLTALYATTLGVEPCGLRDTYNDCLDSDYEIDGLPTLRVTEPPKQQNGVNLVQVTAPSDALESGTWTY